MFERKVVGGIIAVSSICCAAAAVPPIRAVVLSGDAAPGLPGQVFSGGAVYSPVINASGRVAFGGTTSSGSGIWVEGGSGLEPVALQGAPAPGGGTFDPMDALHVWLSDTGRVGFSHWASGVQAIWLQTPEGLRVLARPGDSAPSSPAGIYSGVNGDPYVTFNKSGVAGFVASVTAPGIPNFVALFNGQPGSVEMAARTRLNLSSQGFTSFGAPKFNNAGVFSLLASVSENLATGLYTGDSDALTAVASWSFSTGTQAPGFPQGVTYALGDTPAGINDQGASVFTARLRGPGIDASNDWGVWLVDSLGLRRIVHEGMQVPGLPEGVQFREPPLSDPRFPAITDQGHIGFFTFVQSADSAFNGTQALVVRSPDGAFRVIARTGGPAPAPFPPGSTITRFGGNRVTPCMNSRGQIVFIGHVQSPGDAEVEAVFGTNSRGELKLLWIAGRDMFEVRPGIQATLGGLDVVSTYPLPGAGSDGRRRSFSADGQFVFPASFTIGRSAEQNSGVFVITIPEGCGAADVAGLGGSRGGDGVLTGDDVVVFFNAFFLGDVALADIAGLGGVPNPDGQLSTDDAVAFLAAYFAGCP